MRGALDTGAVWLYNISVKNCPRADGRRQALKVIKYNFGSAAIDGGSVVALGLFDGVHLAHRELILRAACLAKERGLQAVVFTFPSENKNLKKNNTRLYSTEQRLALIETLGVDAAVVCDFDEIKNLSAEDFIEKTLIRDCGAEIAVAGFNFRFGRGASAGARELSALMQKSGRAAEICGEYLFRGKTLSASRIREMLSAKNPDLAAEALGVPFFIEGIVSSGLGLGRGMGTPTANLALPEATLSPPPGVYRSAAKIDGRLYPAVTNIGTCPTVGEREAHSETYIIGLGEPIYGKKIKVFLLGYIRDERRFESQEELIMQINVDKNAALPQKGDLIWTDSGPSLP